MKKIFAILMAVLVVFTATACGGKKMETFGMNVQSLVDGFNSEMSAMAEGNADTMMAAMMAAWYGSTYIEDVPTPSTSKLDNGKTANVYEITRSGAETFTMGYKFMEDSKTKEVFYAEIWVKPNIDVNETMVTLSLNSYCCLASAVIDDMTQEKFSGFTDEMSEEYRLSGVFGKEYGKYYFEYLPSDGKISYILTTKEYNDMIK